MFFFFLAFPHFVSRLLSDFNLYYMIIMALSSTFEQRENIENRFKNDKKIAPGGGPALSFYEIS